MFENLCSRNFLVVWLLTVTYACAVLGGRKGNKEMAALYAKVYGITPQLKVSGVILIFRVVVIRIVWVEVSE